MELSDILTLTVEGLRDKLGELGLSTDGVKTVLQERLIRHFQSPSTVDDGHSDYGKAASGDQHLDVYQRGPSTFTLRDIKDTLSKFSGEGQPEVRQWLRDFEDCAETVRWNDLLKYIYGRQLLTGAAKLFVRSQNSIRNWTTLRSALCSEFGVRLSSIEVHRLLKNRRKKSTESLREYLYSLMEIGSAINLDQESVIEYFVEGIPDSRSNKTILYQAVDIDDLKAKIKVYEKIRGSSQLSNTKVFHQKEEQEGTFQQQEGGRKCFKCGDKNHLANQCKSETVKCFKCKEYGHKSFNCKKNTEGSLVVTKKEENNVQMLSLLSSQRIFTNITVCDQEITAIVDTGSDRSCLRKELWQKMNVKLNAQTKILSGIGQKDIITLGCFTANVNLDGTTVAIIFHVVDDRDILYPALIGNDVLEYVSMTVGCGGARFSPKTFNDEHDSELEPNISVMHDALKELIDDDVMETEDEKMLEENSKVRKLEPLSLEKLMKKKKREDEALKKRQKEVAAVRVSQGGIDTTYNISAKRPALETERRQEGRERKVIERERNFDRRGRGEDRNRMPERQYNINDMVAIKLTRFDTGVRLKPKFSGPYKVIRKLNNGCYEVEKIGEFEGTGRCITVAECMKPWGSTFGSNATSGGPNVGSEGKGRGRSPRLREPT